MRKTLGIFVAVSALSRHASARAILTYQGRWNTEISQGLAKHHECLSKSYFGAYGQGPTHIFISEFDCLNHVRPSPDDPSEMTIMQDDFLQSPGVLFWLEGAAVADSVRSVGDKTAAQDIMDFIERANTGAGFDYSTGVVPNNGAQMPMKRDSTLQDSNTANSVSLLFAAGSRALVSISPSLIPELDKSLPKYIRPTMLPTSPLPLHGEKTKKAAKHLQSILANLRFNPDIAALTSSISLEKMQNNIRWLTGEDPTSPIASRHSFSPDARVAANWIQKKFEDAGAKCKQKPFLDGFAPNVICRFQGTEDTDELVILSGHYGKCKRFSYPANSEPCNADSRGSFGSLRAPGGDDDGSGVTQVLAIAQAISDNEISFRKNVELITFAGEEQGLLGSRAYAGELCSSTLLVVKSH